MSGTKTLLVILFGFLLLTSCSLVDKLKEKMSSKDDKQKEQTKETTSDGKEKTVESTSADDLAFYNKYIDVSNKISEAGDGLHKSYLENIPDPKSVKKGMFLVTVAFDFKVGEMERAIKDNKRSLFDGGELSKLKANSDMKTEVEGAFKTLLDDMEGYLKPSQKVEDYYKEKEYEQNPSKASDLDSEMKSAYEKYKVSYDKFNAALKKNKPKKNKRDPESISDPTEKSLAVLMNAYENTLDGAEGFFGKFQKIENGGDMSDVKKELDSFRSGFETEQKNIEAGSYTDVTKAFKYNFQDYFTRTVGDFNKEAGKFLDNASGNKMKPNDFNKGYDGVVNNYNNMINAYNSSISSLNMIQQYH